MKKIINKLIMFASCAIIGTCLISAKPVYASTSSETASGSLLDRYYSLLELESAANRYSTTDEHNTDWYTSEFSIFDSVIDVPTISVLEDNTTNGNKEAILKDTTNDMLIYASVIDDSSMNMIINGYEYSIVADESSVWCVSESGDSLKVLDNTSTDDPTESYLTAINSENNTNGSWVLAVQHLKGTNTLMLQAIGIISSVAGVIVWKCQALSMILNITGLFSSVGQSLSVTLYTDSDRYYMSDCTTYFKVYTRYYQYSNYTGYSGSGTSYFHSVRPDYAGQNCMAYA